MSRGTFLSGWADTGMAGRPIDSDGEDSIIDINNVAQADERQSSTSMDSELYRGIKMGNLQSTISLQEKLSPRRNTVLHLAASLGHEELVEPILESCPELFMTKNSTDDIALHLAAAFGKQSTVESLLSHAKQLGIYSLEALMDENSEKNTALHLAVRNHHYNLAMLLVEENPQASTRPNAENMSPLFMAAEAGQLDLVNAMMRNIGAVDIGTVEGKSVVHAAIKARDLDVLGAVLNQQSSYIYAYDGKGRSPLSYASSIGYLEGVSYFLGDSNYKVAPYLRDRDWDGSYPIHWASSRGRVKIIREFLRLCPDSMELLNKDGQNILHVAAKKGMANVVSYVLKNQDLEILINERDENDGNTPLHLATKWEQARVVHILTWDKRVDLAMTNYEGLTAVDVATERLCRTTFQKRLTWLALIYASVRGPQMHQQNTATEEAYYDSHYSERVSTLLLVAILTTTVTFTAGFTMPGGFNSSSDGMATLNKKQRFHIFLLCDTIAMYSSIIVAILLIWAMLNDLRLSLCSLKLAIPLLGISLSMVSLAFMAAISLVVSNVTWLSTLVLIIGSLFLLGLWITFLPLSYPNSLTHPVYRYILRYPLYLLILATEKKKK